MSSLGCKPSDALCQGLCKIMNRFEGKAIISI